MTKLVTAVALLLSFCGINAFAQSYLISFAGKGASSIVNDVEVNNLTADTSIVLNGTDILSLNMITTDISSVKDNYLTEMKIYPNPMTDKSIMEICPPVAGNAVISIFDISGHPIAQIQSYLEKTIQSFMISAINKGFYLVKIEGQNYRYSGKLISNCSSSAEIRIERIIRNIQVNDGGGEKKVTKGALATVDMPYSFGDILRFTGTSGNYRTVVMTSPTSDKIITFNFIACTDGSDNQYPSVEIGSQTWMTENLKTTFYNDGTVIPLVEETNSWKSLVSPAYCWYMNSESTNKARYGGLYNWYSVNTGKLCPTGWHVPASAEWMTLIRYLGGSSIAGDKLKETGSTNWGSDPWGYNHGTNESGFTARGAGCRSTAIPIDASYCAWEDAGWWGHWWNSDETSSNTSYNTTIGYRWGNVSLEQAAYYGNKKSGLSVRCIKD